MAVRELFLLFAALSCCHAGLQKTIEKKWNGGFKMRATLTADQDMTSWKMLLSLSGTLDTVEASGFANTQSVNSNTYRLSNLPTNGNLVKGQQVSGIVIVRCSNTCKNGNSYTASLALESGGGSSGGSGSSSGSSDSSGSSSGSSGGSGSSSGSSDSSGSSSGSSDSSGSSSGSSGGSGSSSGSSDSSGSSSGSSDSSGSSGNSGGTKNYKDALKKAILFYYAQRSGVLTGTYKPFSWVVSSATRDNPAGGWYDAGDYVKFNLPMAWSVVTQLWSAVQFRAGYQAAGQYSRAKDSARWPLDYLLRCWDNGKQQLVVQVGDGNADHAVWDRPQNMASNRPTLRVSSSKPGSDVAGETAAALALGYMVFKDSDATFANKMLTAAKQVYSFAKAHKGKYSDSFPSVAQFYKSSGYKDELCVAALWLKRATGNNAYLNDAENQFYTSGTSWAYSWDNNELACQTLLYEETGKAKYKSDVEGYFKAWTGGSNPPHTPCGLAWRIKWGANRYAANSAFMALVAARVGIQSVNGKSLNKFAVEQVNYILGDNAQRSGSNCYSFLIGYGNNFPQRPHHRAASCPADTSQPCLSPQDSRPNPNQLTGALVGGPDRNDQYTDRRADYVLNEVAVDYNAGLQSALAGIVQLQKENNIPTTNNKCKCP